MVDESSFAAKNEKKRKNKRMKAIIACVVAVLIVGGAIFGFMTLSKAAGSESTSKLTYNVGEVKSGEVTTSISGSGTLAAKTDETVTSQYAGTVISVSKKVGDTVSAGEQIAVISSEELDAAIENIKSQLSSVSIQLAGTDETGSSKYIRSTIAGRVKCIQAAAGDVVEDVLSNKGYLCVISTDGKMQLTFTTASDTKKYDDVVVKIGDSTEDGVVTNVSGNTVTVEIEDNSYKVGTVASVADANGSSLGSGALELCNYVEITGSNGVIGSVLRGENDTVSANSTLFKLKDYPASSQYQELVAEKESLEEQLASLTQQKYVSVDFDGKITDLNLTAGEEVAANTSLATVSSTDGYDISVSVDELDIDSVSLGQSAVVTLDALKGTFAGTVSKISYTGTANNLVTSYSVTVTTGAIEGALPGMSASCEITTDSSGETLMVPVEAVYTEGGESFVYLAADGMSAGQELASADVNLSSLKKITVKTGMSDGLYIGITGDISKSQY